MQLSPMAVWTTGRTRLTGNTEARMQKAKEREEKKKARMTRRSEESGFHERESGGPIASEPGRTYKSRSAAPGGSSHEGLHGWHGTDQNILAGRRRRASDEPIYGSGGQTSRT